MTNETKKRNKKKMLIIALFIFAVVGIAGYGVYSYYWTEGEFTFDSGNEISITSFDPEVNISDSQSFLGDGGVVSFYCEGESGSSLKTCTADLQVSNNGNVDINVTVNNLTADANIDDSTTGVNPSINSVGYTWNNDVNPAESKRINSGESAILHIKVVADTDVHSDTSQPIEVNEPVTGSYVYVTGSFKLNATQVRD